MSNEKKHVFKVEIEAPATKVWEALVSPELTQQYYHETSFEAAELKAGAAYAYRFGDGSAAIVGEILEVDPPHRLVTTFSPQWSDEIKAEPASRVTWEVVEKGGICTVTITHDELEATPVTYQEVSGGWAPILTGLKSLVETGQPVAAGR